MITFSYVDRAELVDDFLKPAAAGPPAEWLASGIKIDRARGRTFDWALEGQEGKSIVLPESDLTVTLYRGHRVSDEHRPIGSISGRRPDPDRRLQDPIRQERAGHAHGARATCRWCPT